MRSTAKKNEKKAKVSRKCADNGCMGELQDKLKRAKSTAWHKAHSAATRRWEIEAARYVAHRGIKGRFLNFAQGSTAEPKWSKDLFKRLFDEEHAKRQAQVETIERKIERQQRPQAPRRSRQLMLWKDAA